MNHNGFENGSLTFPMDWRYRHTVLTLCTLAFFGTMVARLVISPVVPGITEEFDVNNGMVGLALSGMWAGYALTQFPSGLLGDRFGYRTIILMAIGGTALASAGLVLAPTYPAFLVLTIVLGVATGLHYSPASTFLTREFDKTGRAIGVHVTGGPIAGLLAPIAAAFVGAHYGWRAAIALGAVVAVPVFVLFLFVVRPTAPGHPDRAIRDRFELATLATLLSRSEIVYTIGLSVIGAFSWQATASFLPAFLVAHHGFSGTDAGVLFAVYFLVQGATQPFLGSASDRFSRESIVFVAWSFGLLGYATLILSHHVVAVLAGVACVGVAMGWGAPLQSRFMDVLGDDEQGMGFGLVRTIYMILGASGSVVVGATADVMGWSVSFGLLCAFLALGLVGIALNRVLGLGY